MRTTSAQLRTVDRLKAEHGRVYGHRVRPSGELDVTFIDGHGFVIGRDGTERPA